MPTNQPVLQCQRSNATLLRAQAALDASYRRLKRLEMDKKECQWLLEALQPLLEDPQTVPNTGLNTNPDPKTAQNSDFGGNPG